MDYELVIMQGNCRRAGLPDHLWHKAVQFGREYSDFQRSNSKCSHLGDGWFVIFDHPLAEQWSRECSWETQSHRGIEPDENWKDTPSSYTLVHFLDPRGEVEMKLRWC